MTNKLTRKEVALQFAIAIQLLLDWIDQKENSNEKPTSQNNQEVPLESHLLTTPEVARILNISKGAAYQLIQQRKIPSIRFNRNVEEALQHRQAA